MKFNCSKCGSDEIYEQHSILIPMNKDMGWEFNVGDCIAEGVFYCDDCQGVRRPIKEDDPTDDKEYDDDFDLFGWVSP